MSLVLVRPRVLWSEPVGKWTAHYAFLSPPWSWIRGFYEVAFLMVNALSKVTISFRHPFKVTMKANLPYSPRDRNVSLFILIILKLICRTRKVIFLGCTTTKFLFCFSFSLLYALKIFWASNVPSFVSWITPMWNTSKSCCCYCMYFLYKCLNQYCHSFPSKY